MKKCTIKLIWGEAEKRWHTEPCEDLGFGFTLEHDSFDVLVERVRVALPEMFELIGYTDDLQICFEAERVDEIKANAA
jgi:hypothetical protein